MAGDVVCEKCGMKFVNDNNLKDHLTQVHEQDHFQCQSCNKILDDEAQFRTHMNIHTQFQQQ